MEKFQNILIIQTAFIGDAILTLPLIQALKQTYSGSLIDVVAVPKSIDIFANHPAIAETIPYDKHGKDKGIRGFLNISKRLKKKKYDLIIVPHRSLRSAYLTWLQQPRKSIGFDRSSGRWLFTEIVKYDSTVHEIDRNLSLLNPLGISPTKGELPQLYPSEKDISIVDSLLKEYDLNKVKNMVAVAPGTIWNTKRWPADRFANLCRQLSSEDTAIFLMGGSNDKELCSEVLITSKTKNIFNVAGRLSLLQSAELIKRCKVLISNDSAPMHLGVAVRTPVVAIFGATVPEFGFAPIGENDIIIETKGLDCRPCAIHGGNKCPIKTFECMLSIDPNIVYSKVISILKRN